MTKLEEYRDQIDKIDTALLELLSKRFKVVQKVGEYKKENNLPVIDRSREQALLDKLEAKGKKHNLPRNIIESIWTQIFKAAYTLEQ